MSQPQSRPPFYLRVVSASPVDVSATDTIPQPDQRTLAIDWSILMARAQDGDAHAYRRLLMSIAPYIRSLARPILKNPADIEDALQDVLITVHTVRATYDPKRPFGPWLKTVARRKILDKFRQNSRRMQREAELNSDIKVFAADSSSVQEDQDPGNLETLILQLPNREAQAIRLTKIEGLSLTAAAAVTGLTAGAIKVAVHRAISRLKSIVRDSRDHD